MKKLLRHLSLWLLVLTLPVQSVGAAATLSCSELTELRHGAGYTSLAVIDVTHEVNAHCDPSSHHRSLNKTHGKARGCQACSACSAASPLALVAFLGAQALSLNGVPPASVPWIFASTTPETVLRPPSRHL